MCNNPKVDHVNINAHINLVRFYKVFLKILSGNKIMMDGQNDRQPKSNRAPALTITCQGFVHLLLKVKVPMKFW